MRAGILHEQVTLQQKSITRDAYGAEVISWTTHATVRASIEPMRGREYMEARQTQADVDTRIRIRYLSTVAPTMRVLWGTRVYDIQSVIHVGERREETQLMCREQINA